MNKNNNLSWVVIGYLRGILQDFYRYLMGRGFSLSLAYQRFYDRPKLLKTFIIINNNTHNVYITSVLRPDSDNGTKGIIYEILNTLINPLKSLTNLFFRVLYFMYTFRLNTLIKYLISLKIEPKKTPWIFNIFQKGYTPIFISGEFEI